MVAEVLEACPIYEEICIDDPPIPRERGDFATNWEVTFVPEKWYPEHFRSENLEVWIGRSWIQKFELN